jgi:hypothetical protein
MKTFTSLGILILIILLFSCGGQKNKMSDETEKNASSINIEKIELTALTRQVYDWHMNNRIDEFPYSYEEQQDSIFSGIDWVQYQSNINLIENTGFFASDFFRKHKTIAMTLDSSIKKADITWRNLNDGIPLWETNADDWCGCQDYPDNYWEFLRIDSLSIENDYAEFIWTWDPETNRDSHTYKLSAKRENGRWKISSLEGFKYYYSVEHYDKLMNED